jgi:peptide/nickel transport system permease protein
MARYLVRRLVFIPVVLIVVSLLSFAYARAAQKANAALNPFIAGQASSEGRVDEYLVALGALLSGETRVPGVDDGPSMLAAALQAAGNSLGLLALAFLLSLALGLGGGLLAVRIDRAGASAARVGRWLLPFTSLGMAMPGFYLGAVLISIAMALPTAGGSEPLVVPYHGYGWDTHLVLPVVALALRPASQIARLIASLMAEESGKRHIVTARSVGVPWSTIRRRHLLRIIAAPVALSIAGAFRLLVAELIVVEWLFGWPGLGRMTAWSLIPPRLTNQTGAPLFLYPPALAVEFTLLAALFLIVDLAASLLAQAWDPRLRHSAVDAEREAAHA